MDKFSELKAAALAATPGPWKRTVTRFNGITNSTHSMASFSSEGVLANANEKRDAIFIAAANPAVVLELLAELEAKDKRILELDYLRLSACEVFKKIGNELGCNPDNESIMMAIDDLKATQMTGPLKDVLKRNIELESKMATPVQPPELTGDEDLAECVFKYVAAIRAAGFTVEGDE